MSAKRSQSVKDRLKAAKLPERSLQVCLRGDLQAEFDDLERQLREARQSPAATGKRIGSKSDATAIVEKMTALQEQMADEMLGLRVRALPRAEWYSLRLEHPPKTEEDEAAGVDIEGFMAEVLPLCLVEPEMDAEDWDQFQTVLSPGDFDRLLNVVWDVNRSGVDIPKSRLASLVMAESDAASK